MQRQQAALAAARDELVCTECVAGNARQGTQPFSWIPRTGNAIPGDFGLAHDAPGLVKAGCKRGTSSKYFVVAATAAAADDDKWQRPGSHKANDEADGEKIASEL
jgi:hypothetical protein